MPCSLSRILNARSLPLRTPFPLSHPRFVQSASPHPFSLACACSSTANRNESHMEMRKCGKLQNADITLPTPLLSNPLHQCAAPSLNVYRDYQLLIRMKMMRPTESRTRANGHVNGQRANWPTARAASPSTSLPLLSVSLSFPPIISYIDDQRHVLCAERSQSDKRQTSFAS